MLSKNFKNKTRRVFLFLAMASFPIHAHSLTSAQQDFIAGIEYIKQGDRHQVGQIRETLENHPLLPIFIYQDIIRNLDNTPSLVIESFLTRYGHLAISSRLSEQWLQHLAEQQDWSRLLEKVRDPLAYNQNIQCGFYQAQLNQQHDLQALDPQALDPARTLWLSQLNLTPSCQRLEADLLKHNQLPGWLVWQKIEAALTANQTDTAKTLAKHLSRTDRQAVQHWISFHNNPKNLIIELPDTGSAFINRKIFLHSLNRLANLEPQTAKKILNLQQQRYQIHPDEQHTILRTASLRLAIRSDEDAQDYLQAYHQYQRDPDTLRWQAQTALRQSDWSTLLNALEQMEADQRQEKKWQYWHARALQQLNQTQRANELFKKLAHQRDYYGFLAADQLNLDYNLTSQPTASAEQLQTVKTTYPALRLIEDLLAVGWQVNATREWNHLLNHADEKDLTAIAQIAHNWQTHVFAFRALAQGQQWDQLSLRFPTPYQQPVMQNAAKNNIDPAWIYSIMRRESAYQTDIRSHAGAVGLMQLRPSTARYIGRQHGLSRQTYQNLTDAQSNIELGAAYLGYLMKKFDGHLVKATAAYNAGPRRVETWTTNIEIMSADQWVDSLPFTETRRYVKAVLEHKIIFSKLLEQQPQRLSHIMLPINAN